MYLYMPTDTGFVISVITKKYVLSFNLANVHDLYKQATLEIHGAFYLLFGILVMVVVGVLIKIHFEGPSCPSPTRLTGTFSSCKSHHNVCEKPVLPGKF